MSRTIKTIISTISILLILTILLGLCFEVFGTDNIKPSNWFDKSEGENQDNNKDNAENVNTVISIDSTEFLSLASYNLDPEEYEAYGVAEASESAMTLTATIKPDETTNKTVNFSANWLNANSSWANGKNVNEYISVQKAGVSSATVSCLQPFGEQIVVTAQAVDNPDLIATCTFNYVKKVLDVSLILEGESVQTYPSYDLTLISLNSDITVRYEVIYSDGTIQGTFSGGVLNTTLDSAFSNALRSSCSADLGTAILINKSANFINADLTSSQFASVTVGDIFTFVNSFTGNESLVRSRMSEEAYRYVQENHHQKNATLRMSYSYVTDDGVGSISSATASMDLWFNYQSMKVLARSIAISNDTFTF